MLDVAANTDSLSNDFMTNAAGYELLESRWTKMRGLFLLTEHGLAPARSKSVKIRTADTAVSDLDVDVVLLPDLGLETAPFHLAVHGLRVTTKPSFKLVIGRHVDLIEKSKKNNNG